MHLQLPLQYLLVFVRFQPTHPHGTDARLADEDQHPVSHEHERHRKQRAPAAPVRNIGRVLQGDSRLAKLIYLKIEACTDLGLLS